MAYIGRSGWNTLECNASIPDEEILDAIDDSYRLVVAKLAKKHRPQGWDEWMSTVRQVQVTFDCADPAALGQFWAEALGYRMRRPARGV